MGDENNNTFGRNEEEGDGQEDEGLRGFKGNGKDIYDEPSDQILSTRVKRNKNSRGSMVGDLRLPSIQ
jgi:hypothetical protein